jgi:hypothetical protein
VPTLVAVNAHTDTEAVAKGLQGCIARHGIRLVWA